MDILQVLQDFGAIAVIALICWMLFNQYISEHTEDRNLYVKTVQDFHNTVEQFQITIREISTEVKGVKENVEKVEKDVQDLKDNLLD